jgi:hypothetical protein
MMEGEFAVEDFTTFGMSWLILVWPVSKLSG